MRTTVRWLAAISLTVASAAAGAAPPQLVVLRFTGAGFAPATLDSATGAAETAALRVAGGRLKVVTRDMLAAVVGEQKLLACEAAARCELDLGVGLGTGYMLSGALRRVGARVELTVKLYDVQKLELLGQEKETAGREEDVLDRIEPTVERIVRTGLALGAHSAGRAAPSLGAFQEEATTPTFAEAEEVVVAFQSDPAGATVLVDGQVLCKETPCSKHVAVGAHQASFQKERYAPAAQRFTARRGATVRATLAPRFGWVSVETSPPGVAIAIGGAEVGKSPVAWREVDEGTVDVVIADPCWLRGGEKVAVKANERRAVRLTAKPRIAGLKVYAEDGGGNALEAPVKVDGVEVGVTGQNLAVAVCSRRVSVPLGDGTFEADLKLEERKVATVVARPGSVGRAAPTERKPKPLDAPANNFQIDGSWLQRAFAEPIVPGVALGGVKLGDTEDQVNRALGTRWVRRIWRGGDTEEVSEFGRYRRQTVTGRALGEHRYLEYMHASKEAGKYQLAITFDERQRVSRIRLSGELVEPATKLPETSHGARLGMTVDELRDRLGAPGSTFETKVRCPGTQDETPNDTLAYPGIEFLVCRGTGRAFWVEVVDPDAKREAGAAPRSNPFTAGSVWKGSYRCAQGETDLEVRVVESVGTSVRAVFAFDNAASGKRGQFWISGTYDLTGEQISFSPGAWIDRPFGYETVGIAGSVTSARWWKRGGLAFEGTVLHPKCTSFSVTRRN